MRFTKKFELSMRFVGANRFAKAAAPKRKHHVLPYFQVVHNRMAWAHMTVKRFAFNDGTFPHMVQAGISAARAVPNHQEYLVGNTLRLPQELDCREFAI